MSPNYTPQIIKRFWSKVAMSDGCWLWTGCRNAKGYGSFYCPDKVRKAHRIAWEIANGEIPTGIQVCHHCDNPSCVRPDHLFLGTQSDNSQDMVRKHRHWLQKEPKRSLLPTFRRAEQRGEQNENAKTNDNQVREIRRLHQEGYSSRQIASLFDMSERNIRRIIRGELWSHVE